MFHRNASRPEPVVEPPQPPPPPVMHVKEGTVVRCRYLPNGGNSPYCAIAVNFDGEIICFTSHGARASTNAMTQRVLLEQDDRVRVQYRYDDNGFPQLENLTIIGFFNYRTGEILPASRSPAAAFDAENP